MTIHMELTATDEYAMEKKQVKQKNQLFKDLGITEGGVMYVIIVV